MFEMKVPGSNGRTYNVHQGADGAWVCSCPAWRFQRVPGNARTCKHITKVTLSLATHVQHALQRQ